MQIGAFANRANAERLRAALVKLGIPATVSRRENGRVLWIVVAGRGPSKAAASQLRERIRRYAARALVVRAPMGDTL